MLIKRFGAITKLRRCKLKRTKGVREAVGARDATGNEVVSKDTEHLKNESCRCKGVDARKEVGCRDDPASIN